MLGGRERLCLALRKAPDGTDTVIARDLPAAPTPPTFQGSPPYALPKGPGWPGASVSDRLRTRS